MLNMTCDVILKYYELSQRVMYLQYIKFLSVHEKYRIFLSEMNPSKKKRLLISCQEKCKAATKLKVEPICNFQDHK